MIGRFFIQMGAQVVGVYPFPFFYVGAGLADNLPILDDEATLVDIG